MQFKGIDTLAGNPLQGHGAVLECGLQRQRVERIAGHGIDGQLLTDQVVPVKRRKAVARHDPVADTRREHGLPTPRANGHLVFLGNAQTAGIFRVDFNERAGLQLVQRRYLAGLGQGVPVVLHAAGVEHQGVGVIRQLSGGQPGPGEEACLATGRGEGDGRPLPLVIEQQRLAAAIVQVTQRAAVLLAPGALGHCRGC